MKKKRSIRIEDDIAYVPLTQGYEAVIDATDVPLVDGYNWRAYVRKWAVYAVREEPTGDSKYRNVRMHRQIMGSPDGMEVDHKDHDGLNNRRENLRVCTVNQNRRNQRLSSRSSTGLKGVTWNKLKGRYQAGIKVNGKRKHLGLFDQKEDAYAAYCEASEKYHGEFGCAS